MILICLEEEGTSEGSTDHTGDGRDGSTEREGTVRSARASGTRSSVGGLVSRFGAGACRRATAKAGSEGRNASLGDGNGWRRSSGASDLNLNVVSGDNLSETTVGSVVVLAERQVGDRGSLSRSSGGQ